MIYLSIFWVAFILFLLLSLFSKYSDNKKISGLLDRYGMLFFIILGSFAVIAIITKDPISFGTIPVPAEVQWLITIIAAGFGAWKYYLNPLKERVIATEKEVSAIKSDIASLKTDIQCNIKTDLHLIKEHIMGKNKSASA